jgi:hypothetical protein
MGLNLAHQVLEYAEDTTPRNGAPAAKVLLPNPGQDKPEGGQ